MYKSPVEFITKKMNAQIEDCIFEAIQEVVANIDKEELIRALQYDRDQYEQGYRDGKQANNWISVEDRLPKKEGNYIVAEKRSNGETYVSTRCLLHWANGPSWCLSWQEQYIQEIKVTHWMPLPELPTGEEN